MKIGDLVSIPIESFQKEISTGIIVDAIIERRFNGLTAVWFMVLVSDGQFCEYPPVDLKVIDENDSVKIYEGAAVLKKLEQARLEAMATRSPVSARFIQAFLDHGTYDPVNKYCYLAGTILRNNVWQGKSDKKAKNCLNAMCNARVVEGKKRHVASTVIDKHFPKRRWDKISDVVFLE